MVKKNIEADIAMPDALHQVLVKVEQAVLEQALERNPCVDSPYLIFYVQYHH
jgi:hypothetical protein